MPDMLQVEGVTAGYGSAIVLEDISFTLAANDSLAVLGRNGVGKTTLLVTLMGLTRVSRGRLRFDGRDFATLPTHARARSGLGWVPQERFIFPSLTVDENLGVVARPGAWNVKRVYDLFPRLEERRRNLGNQLSGGEQQMLAIGRALMISPKVLLLDEPSMGLAPTLVESIFDTISSIHAQGTSILLVEQNALMALNVASRGYVLQSGQIILADTAANLAANEQVRQAYLGEI